MSDFILETKGLTRDFGHFRALSDVSIAVERDALHAIIGPNGAGKSTYFNVVTGKYLPRQGSVLFDSADITTSSPEERVQLGLTRAFQVASTFSTLSVLENLMIPVVVRRRKGMNMLSGPRSCREVVDEATEIGETVGLADKAASRCDVLSHGDKKKLDIGIALAGRPKLLLLDEPTSGLSAEEIPSLVKLIERLHTEGKTAVLFIEHNMNVVLSIARKVTVLQGGRVIAEGKPDEIRKDAVVVDAYLGAEI